MTRQSRCCADPLPGSDPPSSAACGPTPSADKSASCPVDPVDRKAGSQETRPHRKPDDDELGRMIADAEGRAGQAEDA